MHAIEPARLKNGVDSRTSNGAPVGGPSRDLPRIVEGKALILLGPKRPGEKLDAIDTDQITPAAGCVSESLEAVDGRPRRINKEKA